MYKTRLFVASCIAACLAVPIASPAVAQEEGCPADWNYVDFAFDVIPPNPSGPFVEFDEQTLTIRGDVVASGAAALVDYYTEWTEILVACAQEAAEILVSPYRDCVLANLDAILTSPNPVARYVEAGTDLVVKVHYAQALEDARLLFNCNGIVTVGE